MNTERDTAEALKGNAKPYPPAPDCSVTLAEIIKAFREEIGYRDQRIYALEIKLSRYDRAFEQMFKEELDNRVNGKSRENACGVLREDPFWRLENRAVAMQQSSGGALGRDLG